MSEKTRVMDVSESKVSPGASELRFRGAWLSRAGFAPGAIVKVINRSPGVLEIRVVNERGSVDPQFAQASAALDSALKELPSQLTGQTELCDQPEACARYYVQHLEAQGQINASCEQFIVLALNTRRRVISHYKVADGTLDTILVHPREVFAKAIELRAAALVLMHNHPSGDPTPSEADIKVTRDLIRGGQMLKIEVLDHVIMGDLRDGRSKNFCSLRELGYFYV